ncbi:hypothetical protein [Streptomyces sp. LN245]|uniref:hypothetical protein n=1 Tax=Streptomyces sp. LN245 TaxID=3112975 RepID=UPI0037109762
MPRAGAGRDRICVAVSTPGAIRSCRRDGDGGGDPGAQVVHAGADGAGLGHGRVGAEAAALPGPATDGDQLGLAADRAHGRAAEAQTLEQDKQKAIEEAQLLASFEATDLSDVRGKRLLAERTTQEIKDLTTRAEQALYSGDLALAATLGRKAAIGLIESRGAWTRQAAQHALAGSDDDVFAWIDLDRAVAQGQDDRETTLHVATIAAPQIAEAAQLALESSDSKAVGDFLTIGMKNASNEELRVAIGKILSDGAGKAVTNAANKALDKNTTESLNYFFEHDYPLAQEEDDKVLAGKLIATGGAFTKAYAEVALEGPAWILRNFILVVQFRTAQLDHDTATHVAAIRGAIAAAAKIAEKAQENAARATQAAYEARNNAAKAQEWADKAIASSKKADSYADEARANADAADKSAADAQASANTAKAAAATARGAARSANYSANKAMDSARAALKSSADAQASANAARTSMLAAQADAKKAAAAYTEAKRITAEKHRAEVAAKAKEAKEKAQADREAKRDPAANDRNNQVNPNGTKDPADSDEWWNDAQFYADAANAISIGTGFLSACCFAAGFVFPPAFAAASVLAGVSTGASAIGTLFTGIEHGFTSSEFGWSAAGTGLSLVSFGATKWLGAALKPASKVARPVLVRLPDIAEDGVSSITKGLSEVFGEAA